MTKDEFHEKWDEQVLWSQDASNPSGLLHSAIELLSDWRTVEDDFQGKNCPHLKFLLYQTVFLVFGREMDWCGWHDAYHAIQTRVGERGAQ